MLMGIKYFLLLLLVLSEGITKGANSSLAGNSSNGTTIGANTGMESKL